VILDRHTAMVSNYRKELNIMLGNIQAISSAANSAEKQQRAELAAKHLKKKQHHRPNTFDPDNLPNSSEKPNKNNHPKTSEQAFNDAGFTSSPLARVAVNAPFTYANLAGASDPAYLADRPFRPRPPNSIMIRWPSSISCVTMCNGYPHGEPCRQRITRWILSRAMPWISPR
jgi:hypothetical protein